MPDFPLVPASKGFCLSLDSSLENFKTALKTVNLLWLFKTIQREYYELHTYESIIMKLFYLVIVNFMDMETTTNICTLISGNEVLRALFFYGRKQYFQNRNVKHFATMSSCTFWPILAILVHFPMLEKWQASFFYIFAYGGCTLNLIRSVNWGTNDLK